MSAQFDVDELNDLEPARELSTLHDALEAPEALEAPSMSAPMQPDAPTSEASEAVAPPPFMNSIPRSLLIGAGQITSAKIHDNPPSAARTQCLLPHGLIFVGAASFDCDVQIEAECSGELTVSPSYGITIGTLGKVSGEIQAGRIRVEGSVDGKMNAPQGLVSFGPTALAKGTVTYGRISIEEGAEVEASMKKVSV